MSPAWSGSPERCENMSPTLTIWVTAGSDSANHGSFDTIGVSQPIAFCAHLMGDHRGASGLDSDASWKTVSGSIISPRACTSLTPKPLAYTVFPPCTTATAIPGMPDFFIRSSAIPSSLATALSTALSGSGIAGTSGGGTSDRVCAVGGGAGSAGFAVAAPHQREAALRQRRSLASALMT